jgi:beta-glucanase (GH16 family)
VVSSYDIPYIHYNAASNDPNVTAFTCVLSDPSAFHTYGLQWTPTSLTVLYDGKTCLVDHWNPAWPESGNDPFNQPFFMAITQALGVNSNAFVAGYTPLPATTSVDWVRAWS